MGGFEPGDKVIGFKLKNANEKYDSEVSLDDIIIFSIPSYSSTILIIYLAKSTLYINCLNGLPVPNILNGFPSFFAK